MQLSEKVVENIQKLKNNAYPGRGIIQGKTPDGLSYVQVYFIMGRSENSRNRIFENEDSFVKTQAFDESKVTDPSLIIYYPAKNINNCHIISNGDQTDTIYEKIKNNDTFESAINSRDFEPDEPHFTSRISGIIDLDDKENCYKLSIIKSINNNSKYCERHFFNYKNSINGFGHFIHTYAENGSPLPAFKGEPLLVNIFNQIDETARFYWDILNSENKISLMVKYIEIESGKTTTRILNKNNGE